MFQHRINIAEYQTRHNISFALSTPITRLNQVTKNFYSPNKIGIYNKIIKLQIPANLYTNYSYLLFILFFIGLIVIIHKTFKKNKSSIFLITYFLITLASMMFYLKLDWQRYYVPIVLPIIIFQTIGLTQILTIIPKIYRHIQCHRIKSQ